MYAAAHMYVHCVLFHALRAAISLLVHCMYMCLHVFTVTHVWNLRLLVNFSSDNELVPLIGFDVLCLLFSASVSAYSGIVFVCSVACSPCVVCFMPC